jgi:hypothetical protein
MNKKIQKAVALHLTACHYPYLLVFADLPRQGQRILAGGEAERNHRYPADTQPRPGKGAGRGLAVRRSSFRRPCRDARIFFNTFRWLRCAPPPANIHGPSGAKRGTLVK